MPTIEETKRTLAATEREVQAAVREVNEARQEEARCVAGLAALAQERETRAAQSRAELGLKAKLEEIAAVAGAAARVRRIDEVDAPAAEQALARARERVAALVAAPAAAERRRAEAAVEHQRAELAAEELVIADRVRAAVGELDGLFKRNRDRCEAIRSADEELWPGRKRYLAVSVWGGQQAEDSMARLKGLLLELDRRLCPPPPDPREEAERAAERERQLKWAKRAYEEAHGLPFSDVGLTFGDSARARSHHVEVAMTTRLNEMAEARRAAEAASQEEA